MPCNFTANEAAQSPEYIKKYVLFNICKSKTTGYSKWDVGIFHKDLCVIKTIYSRDRVEWGWNMLRKTTLLYPTNLHSGATVHRDLTLNTYHTALQMWSSVFFWHCVGGISISAFRQFQTETKRGQLDWTRDWIKDIYNICKLLTFHRNLPLNCQRSGDSMHACIIENSMLTQFAAILSHQMADTDLHFGNHISPVNVRKVFVLSLPPAMLSSSPPSVFSQRMPGIEAAGY